MVASYALHVRALGWKLMIRSRTRAPLFNLNALLRGEVELLAGGIARWTMGQAVRQTFIIVMGASAFAAAMGSWREQALWSAVKLPFILLATAADNALLNGMLRDGQRTVAAIVAAICRWNRSRVAVVTGLADGESPARQSAFVDCLSFHRPG